MPSNDPTVDFTLTRLFDAPRELVFRTMTETEHLQKWWGPAGCTIDVLRHEPRPGGQFLYCMRFAPGAEMYGLFDYVELIAPERIVFVNGFADAQGKRIRYELAPTWPMEVTNTITLSEEGGKTRMTLLSVPKDANDVELQTFKSGHASMEQGFGGMYDLYAAYLAKL